MRFVVKGKTANIYNLGRKINYHFLKRNIPEAEIEFVRPAKGYPRFHLFVKIKGENLIFNLHFDQKKPIYKGVPAHAGEYNTEIVKKEAERIKLTIENQTE